MSEFKRYKESKDPDSILDFGRLWGETEDCDGWLKLADSETIDTSTWFITCDDELVPTLTIHSKGSGIFPNSKDTYVWLEGGTPGLEYYLINRIFTTEERTDERTGILPVEER